MNCPHCGMPIFQQSASATMLVCGTIVDHTPEGATHQSSACREIARLKERVRYLSGDLEGAEKLLAANLLDYREIERLKIELAQKDERVRVLEEALEDLIIHVELIFEGKMELTEQTTRKARKVHPNAKRKAIGGGKGEG